MMMTVNRVSLLVISVVGGFGTGKTTLIERLLREFSRRKYTVDVSGIVNFIEQLFAQEDGKLS